MKFRTSFVIILCIVFNLMIGNLALLMFADLAIIYRLIISFCIIMLYGFSFYRLQQNIQKQTRWQLAGISILLSLLGMMIACIFTSIGMRLPTDNIITAGLKGIIPMFVFAIVFASPFWIILAIVNFVCLILLKSKTFKK